jgi:site-specific DNA recombinase
VQRKVSPDKVALYIRWSTEDQGQGHTLAIQLESCRYYCLSQGWAVRDERIFIDDGCSGATLERPSLARLRAAVRDGRIECVVVYKLDRLSRNIRDIINLVLGEWEERCSVRSTQEPLDTTTDAGRLLFTLLGSFADFERATIRTRTWSGKRKNAEQGRNPGMVYPYGYQKGEGAAFLVEETEAAVVREVFDQCLRGRSCRQIALDLNRRGLRTRGGRPWQSGYVSQVLRNPLYAGTLLYNRRARRGGGVADVIRSAGAVPAIVGSDVWEAAARLRRQRRSAMPPRALSSPFLLSGLARCGCGHSWIGLRSGDRRYYACASGRYGAAQPCGSRLVPAAELESAVAAHLRRLFPPAPLPQELLAARLAEQASRRQSELTALRQRSRTLSAALQRFRIDYREGRIDGESFASLSREAAAEFRQVEAALARLEQAGTPPAGTAGTAAPWAQAALRAQADPWECLAPGERRQILQTLVSRLVLVNPKEGAGPSVQVEWRCQRTGQHEAGNGGRRGRKQAGAN